MNRLLRSLAILFALTAFAGGLAAAGPGKAGLLSNERIIAMLKSGVSESTILSLIKQFPEKLDSGPDALVALRAAGASNRVLLAVRRSSLTAAAVPAEAAESEADGGAAGPVSEEEDAAAAPEEAVPAGEGRLSLGLGYPFFAVKYDFADYAGEGRFITRRGIQAFAGRGYWNFLKDAPWTAYTGLEAGYVRYGSAGSGAELSPFLGGAYDLGKDFSFSADISPTLLFFPGGGTHFGIGEIGWVINFGVFFRLPAPGTAGEREEAAAAEPAPAPEPARRRETDENSSWRLVKAPSKSSYQDYLEAAEDYISRKNYSRADQIYEKLLDSVPSQDARKVFLFERRGWLARRQGDLPRARDLYLAAVTAARHAGSYDSNTVNAYCGLAYCFEKQGNVNLAIKYYQRALELSVNEGTRREIERNLERLDPERE
ncbi:MAG: tetratricopeptide repeat protein [Elusimicrobiales bacterium]|nr:tetratricopeptide repeat protein [Elusimicrobiales bacterium]